MSLEPPGYFSGPDGPQCDNCGAPAEWVDCPSCQGTGGRPVLADQCSQCNGEGGWMECVNDECRSYGSER